MVHDWQCNLIVSKVAFVADPLDGEKNEMYNCNDAFLFFSFFKAWIHGDPRKVAYPTDSYGQFCGQKDTPNE